MQWVLEQAISWGKGVVLAPQKRPIGQDEGFQELEVVFPDVVADIYWSPGDSPWSGVELSTWVGGLKHVPVGVYEVAHPQAVVGTMHHVTPL